MRLTRSGKITSFFVSQIKQAGEHISCVIVQLLQPADRGGLQADKSEFSFGLNKDHLSGMFINCRSPSHSMLKGAEGEKEG